MRYFLEELWDIICVIIGLLICIIGSLFCIELMFNHLILGMILFPIVFTVGIKIINKDI